MSINKSYRKNCLSEDSVQVREGVGKNIIPPPEREPLWKLYLEKFKDPIIIVLLVVFFFSVAVAVYEVIYMHKGWSILIEPSGVLIALLLATGVGFFFELKAEQEFEVLNKVKDSRPVKVLRRKSAGTPPRWLNIPKQDVVVDDIVKLESGDEIPADRYLVESTSLRVDESNFTG
jgi:Ca2+-transporting ATPase